MNEIQVVKFHEDQLTVIKMFDDEKIYVSVRNVCASFGLDENRIKAQRTKVTSDPVLTKGKRVILIPTKGGDQNTLCLEVNFLPIWLAKINANILAENVKDKLIDYQLEAKEVLSKVFIQKQEVLPKGKAISVDVNQLSPETQALVMLVNSIAETQLEQKRQAIALEQVQSDLKNMKQIYNLSITKDWRRKTNDIINTVCKNTDDYRITREKLYEKLCEQAHCNLPRLLRNMKERARAAGSSVTTINAINNLNVIGDDKRLTAIYISLVKDLALYNGYTKEDITKFELEE